MRRFTKYPSSYVKANSFRRRMAEEYPDIISKLRKDIRAVARCENQEELQACEPYRHYGSLWESHARDDGIVDFDDKIDMIIAELQNLLDVYKHFLSEKQEEVVREDKALADIETYLTATGISYDTQDDGIRVYPESGTRGDLIQFIDNLIAATGGRYFGTGRGGSWSAWNVLINGIEFQIGPRSVVNLHARNDGQPDCWLITTNV